MDKEHLVNDSMTDAGALLLVVVGEHVASHS